MWQVKLGRLGKLENSALLYFPVWRCHEPGHASCNAPQNTNLLTCGSADAFLPRP
jgi:hypothetical protein